MPSLASDLLRLSTIFAASLLAGSAYAQERPVELELLLAVDSSASVDEAEFAQQRDGLANAFRDVAVISAIESVGELGIAVSYMQWGYGFQQRVAVDWMPVHDAASAEAFARAIEEAPRLFVGNGTSITWALTSGARKFEDNGFLGRRRTIDVSGDGRNNSGGGPEPVRDALVEAGFTINALAILDGDIGLGHYFEDKVIGGTGAFVMTTDTFDDYAEAIRNKLLREILAPVAATPERGPVHVVDRSAVLAGDSDRKM